MNLWKVKKPKITSEKTARKIIPAVHKKINFQPGTVNADIGGGPYELATDYLKEKGVTNIVFDPFQRSDEHNQKAVAAIKNGQADTATVANVLNVIPDPKERAKTIRRAANAVGKTGVAYFQVHEGDGDGKSRATRDGWQEYRKLASYMPEIEKYFRFVTRTKGYIEARQEG